MESWYSKGLLLFCMFACALGSSMSAQAQARFAVTDTPQITVAQSGSNAPYDLGYLAGNFGSITSTKTLDGYTIVGFYDVVRGGKVGGYFSTQLIVGGFSADPGQAWLNSGGANGVTLTGASARSYSYANGQATWGWITGPVFEGKSGSAPCVIAHGGQGVDLNLKFQILGVDYAPPGSKSFTNYGNSTVRGTSTMDAGTFTTSTGYSASLMAGLNFLGLAKGVVTATYSNSYSQENDVSSSIAITSTTANTDIVNGPASSAVGVDHDYDVVWVWINPMASAVVGPGKVVFTGYSYNNADDAHEMELIPLYVYWLKAPSTIPAAVASRLARSWDTSGVGGLTASDYASILAADPFSVAGYNPNTDTGYRFDLQGGQTFSYEPPPPGGQPITEQYTASTQTTSTQGQGAKNTSMVGFSIDFSTGVTIFAEFGADVKISNSYTTTDQWSSAINSIIGKTAALSITGPATSDNYTGPTTMQVWRDNIYGSFMFYPVN
jgi:hypothetical protein